MRKVFINFLYAFPRQFKDLELTFDTARQFCAFGLLFVIDSSSAPINNAGFVEIIKKDDIYLPQQQVGPRMMRIPFLQDFGQKITFRVTAEAPPLFTPLYRTWAGPSGPVPS